MTEQLRERMLKEIEIRGLDEKTKKAYLDSMEKFMEFFKDRPPGQLQLEELKDYQRYLLRERKLAPNSVNRHLSGIKFFYMHVMGRYWYAIALPRVRAPKKIPTILSEEEVANLINAVHNVMYKAVIMVLYSAGLRHAEVRNLKAIDIDSKRMVINVRDGKGKRDGQAILAEMTLKCLRTYWRLFRMKNKIKSDYLFIATKTNHGTPGQSLSHTAVGYMLRVAQKASGIKKKSHPMSCATPSRSILLSVAST